MGPVDALAFAGGPAEERVDGDAERLALDVPERQLDSGDGLGGDPARTLPRQPVHVPVEHLDRHRVAPQQQRLEILDRADDPVGVAPVRHLPVAGDPVRSPHRDELPGPPARIHHERLNRVDLHGEPPPLRSAPRAGYRLC